MAKPIDPARLMQVGQRSGRVGGRTLQGRVSRNSHLADLCHATGHRPSSRVAAFFLKSILEEDGFTLPEPIYRLRFDQPLPPAMEDIQAAIAKTVHSGTENREKSPSTVVECGDEILDVSPDTHLEEKVNIERAMESESDLLDEGRPGE